MLLKSFIASTALLTSSSIASAQYGGGYGYGDGGGGYGDNSATATALLATAAAPSEASTSTYTMTSTVTDSFFSATASAPSAESSTPGTILVQTVHVSDNNGTRKFFPDSLVAEPNTIVEFIFYPLNHTVTQSSFAAPCVPLDVSNTSISADQFIHSGFVPVNASAPAFAVDHIRQSFSIMINDTKPIWLYCGQKGHCQAGMAMVINQDQTDTVHTLNNYIAAAAQVPLPGGSSSSTTGAGYGSSTTLSSASSTTAASSTTSPPSSTTSHSSSSVGPGIFTSGNWAAAVTPIGGMAGLLAAGAMALL